MPRRVAGRVLLVGDAAGYVDALTGEGIAVSLAAARALVEASPPDRPRTTSGSGGGRRAATGCSPAALLAAARRPLVRRALVPAAARLPSVFGAAVDQLAR